MTEEYPNNCFIAKSLMPPAMQIDQHSITRKKLKDNLKCLVLIWRVGRSFRFLVLLGEVNVSKDWNPLNSRGLKIMKSMQLQKKNTNFLLSIIIYVPHVENLVDSRLVLPHTFKIMFSWLPVSTFDLSLTFKSCIWHYTYIYICYTRKNNWRQ